MALLIDWIHSSASRDMLKRKRLFQHNEIYFLRRMTLFSTEFTIVARSTFWNNIKMSRKTMIDSYFVLKRSIESFDNWNLYFSSSCSIAEEKILLNSAKNKWRSFCFLLIEILKILFEEFFFANSERENTSYWGIGFVKVRREKMFVR